MSPREARRISPWGIKRCPRCGAVLDEGPIVYRCAPCGRAVRAADLDNETHAPIRRAA